MLFISLMKSLKIWWIDNLNSSCCLLPQQTLFVYVFKRCSNTQCKPTNLTLLSPHWTNRSNTDKNERYIYLFNKTCINFYFIVLYLSILNFLFIKRLQYISSSHSVYVFYHFKVVFEVNMGTNVDKHALKTVWMMYVILFLETV